MHTNLTEQQLNKVFSIDRKQLIGVTPMPPNRIDYKAEMLSEEWHDILKALSSCLKSSKTRAKQYSWSHNITMRDLAEIYIEQKGKCPITGEIMSPYSGDWNQKNPFKISADRIDSSRGYIKGNVVLVTHWANNAKNTWSTDILESFIEKSYKNLKKSKKYGH